MIRLSAAESALTSIVLLALVNVVPTRAQVNVLTDNYNSARTNANLNETVLNVANVNVTQFGKLFSLPVDGFINAQPLYVANLSLPGKGTHNVVYVATHHNSVYAFDADAAGSALWHVNLGPSVPGSDYNVADLEEIGILSTPVIDAASGTIYVVANTKEDGNAIFRLHALDLATGAEKFGAPAVIVASLPGTIPWDNQNGQVQFVAAHHLQRAGLALVNNTVYIGFGSHGDNIPYFGWLLGYNAANVQQQVSAFLTTPDGGGGGIWQAGRAPAADDGGGIYLATGNGTWDGIGNWAQSLLKLETSNGLKVTDWFTPDNWAHLDDLDNDLGSCGPVLTASGMVIGGGKEGVLYVLDPNNMGHLESGNGQVFQRFQAIGYGIFNMAYWENSDGPMVYMRAYNDAVKGFRITNGRFATTPFTQSSFATALPYDGMAISANGSAPDSAILWLAATDNGYENGTGILYALSAADLSKELWTSNMNPHRDGLGILAKFTAPTVANGKVYLATFSNQLVVYGLLPQEFRLAGVVNAASGQGDAIAPDEMVTLYGSGLGPPTLAGPVLDSSGRLSTSVANTRVLINGAAAPLVYARWDQTTIIVPNAVAGHSSATVEVEYQGQKLAPVSVPVTDTKPGLFTLDESGRGLGAILNQDYSLNVPWNPAEPGSIVVLYGTGQGLTDPDWAEDELASDPLPKPINPVTVTMGGETAEVLYAGAAPGFAALMQINVRIPPGVQADQYVPVEVTIGNNTSQPGVTLAVK